jgi:hypothetical protein
VKQLRLPHVLASEGAGPRQYFCKNRVMELPQIRPMVLARAKEAFDHPEWLFEPKLDGFKNTDQGAHEEATLGNQAYAAGQARLQLPGCLIAIRMALP